MPRITIIAIRTCSSLMWRGSRVNSGSTANGRSASHDDIDPRAGNIDARQLVDDLVDLRDHDAVAKRGGFDDGRRVLGVRAGVEIAVPVGLLGAHAARRAASGPRTCARRARRTCRSRRSRACRPRAAARRAGSAARRTRNRPCARCRARTASRCSGRLMLEISRCMSCTLLRIDLRERARQKVGLLLVVAFERDAVAG